MMETAWIALKSGAVLVGVPVIGQLTTGDLGIWSDYRTWIGAAVLLLLTQGDKALTAARGRWERRTLSAEQLEQRHHERSLTKEDRLQARVDELVSAAMGERDAEITRLRTELLKAQVEREEYRDMALGLGKGGEQAREARKRLASREMHRTHPGAREVDAPTLEEWSEDDES